MSRERVIEDSGERGTDLRSCHRFDRCSDRSNRCRAFVDHRTAEHWFGQQILPKPVAHDDERCFRVPSARSSATLPPLAPQLQFLEIDQMPPEVNYEELMKCIGFAAADALARKGVDGFSRWVDASGWTPQDMLTELTKYPHRLGFPSLASRAWISVFRVGPESHGTWAVEVPLTLHDGSRSDMYMMIEVVVSIHGYRIEFDKFIVS